MASQTALALVNRVLITTGDYNKLTTVVGSPADIAERIIEFLNFTLKDICRDIDFPVLQAGFTGIADGLDSQFIGSGIVARGFSTFSCSVGNTPLTEKGIKDFYETKIQGAESGAPLYFTRITSTNNEAGVEIYPTPTSGAKVTVLVIAEPTLFTLSDTATTEIAEDDLLILGTLAHMDTYDGLDRGYVQLYELKKAKLWTHIHANENLRVISEDYR